MSRGDFEVLPVGTIAALEDTAKLLRSYERHHREQAGFPSAEEAERWRGRGGEKGMDRLAKAERNRLAAERLEGLLRERLGAKPTTPTKENRDG